MVALGRRAALGGIAAGLAAPAITRAQAWPAGPIRTVVPFPPGGSTDAVARLASPGLQAALGVPIVVAKRSGAAGSIGTGAVASASPDGNTWLLSFDSHAVLETMTTAQQARLVLSTPEECGRFVARETEVWSKVVRDNAIRPD